MNASAAPRPAAAASTVSTLARREESNTNRPMQTPSFHPRLYRVSARDKAPLHRFIHTALAGKGATILWSSPDNEAPHRVAFELPSGERAGLAAYAFFANSKATRNRPHDEHRFQVKYGSKDGQYHELWQDPLGIYTTLFCGIDLERGVFIGADPVLHNPTRFFISIEYKEAQIAAALHSGWTAWERDRRQQDEPVEVLVAGKQENLLKYVQFERAAVGESQGHRHLLAERHPRSSEIAGVGLRLEPEAPAARLHALAQEFALAEIEVLDLIANARRLKMAVRGWVAEEHLTRLLRAIPGVADCRRRDDEGGPDVSLVFDRVPLTVECKNVLRRTDASGCPRVDFQRTRTSKSDPCSRFYAASDFDVLAACLNAVENRWNYRFQPTTRLSVHPACPGKLSPRVRVDDSWIDSATTALAEAAKAKS